MSCFIFSKVAYAVKNTNSRLYVCLNKVVNTKINVDADAEVNVENGVITNTKIKNDAATLNAEANNDATAINVENNVTADAGINCLYNYSKFKEILEE